MTISISDIKVYQNLWNQRISTQSINTQIQMKFNIFIYIIMYKNKNNIRILD